MAAVSSLTSDREDIRGGRDFLGYALKKAAAVTGIAEHEHSNAAQGMDPGVLDRQDAPRLRARPGEPLDQLGERLRAPAQLDLDELGAIGHPDRHLTHGDLARDRPVVDRHYRTALLGQRRAGEPQDALQRARTTSRAKPSHGGDASNLAQGDQSPNARIAFRAERSQSDLRCRLPGHLLAPILLVDDGIAAG